MFMEDADAGLVTDITDDMCAISPEVGLALLRAYSVHDLYGSLADVEAPVRSINGPMWPTNVEGNRRYDPDFDVMIIEGSEHLSFELLASRGSRCARAESGRGTIASDVVMDEATEEG